MNICLDPCIGFNCTAAGNDTVTCNATAWDEKECVHVCHEGHHGIDGDPKNGCISKRLIFSF